jgi:hypothetical protein
MRNTQADVPGHPLNLEADANARLIAAAPELLAALEWIKDYADDYPWTGMGDAKDQGGYETMMSDARAAIAKAKGDVAPGH